MKNFITCFSLLLVFLVGCQKDDYLEIPSVCPIVTSTSPLTSETDVPIVKTITATFNTSIDPSTITQQSFTVLGATPVSGTVSYLDKTASFRPTNVLSANTTYTVRITTAVMDLMGNALQTDYVWSFSTGSTLLPIVVSTDPANLATNIPLNQTVSATFSMAMDPNTINATNFTLFDGATPVSGAVSYSGLTASFVPSSNLTTNKTYTATIKAEARKVAGIALLNDYVWTFSTGSMIAPTVIATDPLNSEANVVLNKTITATFSEPMNGMTITGTTFTLYQGIIPVAGSVSYVNSVATFIPTSNLLSGTNYTATITTGAMNPSGTPLTNDYIWNFMTGTGLAPTVVSTDPFDGETGVTLGKILVATFSEAMDPATLSATTFTLSQGMSTVSGIVSVSGVTATFDPTSNLSSGTTYTATITTGAKNIAGTSIANNYVWTFNTGGASSGAPAVNLRSVARFGIIAGVGVSNNAGQSEIHNMDVGISPGNRSSTTGFPPAIIVNGAIYASDDLSPPNVPAMLTQAKQDLTDAYLFAEAATFPAPAIVSGDIGGTTLAPGIYKSTSTLMIQSGDLTLDAQGNPDAAWIFQIASDFTTIGGAGGNVILSGGAQAKNIFWQTGSSATIGDYTIFKGNVLALTSITMNSHAIATGRMLARNGAVVMTSTNKIIKP